MNRNSSFKRSMATALMALIGTMGALQAFAQDQKTRPAAGEIRILEMEGTVEFSRAGSVMWDPAYTNQVLHTGDRIRTRERSRLTLLWSDESTVRLDELSHIQIDAAHPSGKQTGFSLLRGMLYFFHRDKPTDVRFNTRTASAAVRGTEFHLAIDDNGRTTLTMRDGEVVLSNTLGQIGLTSGEQGIADPGQVPTKTAVIDVINVIQWCLYYPAVLDLDELATSVEERQTLNESLAAYRSGDVLQALAKYPADRQPVSAAEKVYAGALLLAVGQVEQTETLFRTLDAAPGAPVRSTATMAGAVRQLIAAVKFRPAPRDREPASATEWLAESYDRQARADLKGALAAARQAVTKSPQFGFGWARVAELEFGFGRVPEAMRALDRSLGLAPRNAAAITLKGFLLAAQNKVPAAIQAFDLAIATDGAIGNAWLGRGLCRIRRGDAAGGREDLLMAATLEPQRAALRSYLGKAYSNAGDTERATKELNLAKQLDPNDPTAWLYSALVNQRDNRINEGIDDLEKSQSLNKNRQVYRSELLLDQDRAVRAANLANVYQDAGMFDVSVREAGRAVNDDYANYSAHLFLANSYDQLRDPNRINLRYETPAISEYLIANLLAPVGAGTLSQSISQQEYSKLFERDRLGVSSSTEYLSRGAWTQSGAQYGTFGNSSYSFEAFYRSDPGQRPNNDFEETALSLSAKQQITPEDSLFVQALYYTANGGDVIQYYDPSNANPGLRTKETQEPAVLAGYHHEWSPGVHTLFLGACVNDTISVNNPAQVPLLVERIPGGLDYVQYMTINQAYQSKLGLYSAEAQQIWESPKHTTIVGARFQAGDIQTENLQTNPSLDVSDFFPQGGVPAADQNFTTDFTRASVYAYHDWRIFDPLLVTVGLSYDWIQFPKNFRAAPISSREQTEDQLSPKAGLIWTPSRNTTFRAAYTKSLAGASLDQSLQLEPTQVAGFLQSFRSIIPESVGGAEAGAKFETYGLSFEQKFPTRTYLGLSGGILNSKVDRTLGTFEIDLSGVATPGSTQENIDYQERTLLLTIDQLIGEKWSIGARYRLSDADLKDNFPEVLPNLPPGSLVPPFQASQHLSSTLNQLELHAIFNHPSGFFAQFQALWYQQSNRGYTLDIPGDDFWQFNVFGGYRFLRRKAELTLGVLNLTGQDYNLNPLTLYNELPRERTFAVRLRFSF